MSRGEHKTDSKRCYDWMFYAYGDIISARLLSTDKRLYSMAAFHCQQCAEKALKAFLLSKNHKLMDGHNLTWLCKQAALVNDGFARWIAESAMLNRYYIETRYPADILLEVDREALEQITVSAEGLLEFAAQQIKFDYASYHKKNVRR